MTALFSFSFTIKLPVYTVGVYGGTNWYGFSKQSHTGLHWTDLSLGLLYVSLIHRRRYEAAINSELHKIFGDGKQTGIRVLRRNEQTVELSDTSTVDKDLLN